MFVGTDQIKHHTVAFLPETFRYLPSGYADYKKRDDYAVSAYWHTISKGKHTVNYGAVAFFFGHSEPLPCKPEDLTYGQVLQLMDSGVSRYTLYMPGHTFGGVKPRHMKKVFEAAEGRLMPELPVASAERYSEASLLQLLQTPEQVPDGADGWYLPPKSSAL